MTTSEEIYQQVIIDHYKQPRNYGPLDQATHHAQGQNPLCGDEVTVHVRIDAGKVAGITFEGKGCAISKASASLMTEGILGLSLEETRSLFDQFHALITNPEEGTEPPASLGKLRALAGVSKFPARVKCATLAWHALRAAIAGQHDPVSTEA